MSSEGINPAGPRRKAMKVAVAALCTEAGFSYAEDAVLETLTEMIQSYMSELSRSTRAFAELTGRTEPLVSDVVMALVEMGTDVESLPGYGKRHNKSAFMPPTPALPTANPRVLQVGKKKNHPSYVPEYLPSFPDPHTYIKTATQKPPTSDYQMIREKAASQKRDVERALTRFIAKTGETESLFQDDPYAYPLIANKSKPIPYIDVLIQKDEDLDSLAEDDVSKAKHSQSQKQQEKESKTQAVEADSQANKTDQDLNASFSEKANASIEVTESDNAIDNPYLRPIKMPKIKGMPKKYNKWS